MLVTPDRKLTLVRMAAFLLGLLALHGVPACGQKKPERFWLAGRYDGNRVVVYFEAVKFEGTMPSNARRLAPPVAGAFFEPVELPASYVARFQKKPNAEHFLIGDRYDLLLGNGTIATIKLTTLVGCETDEPVGNDSFIGALGTLESKDSFIFTNEYYAVRRHQEPQTDGASLILKTTAEFGQYPGIVDEPIRFDIEARIAELLNQRMKMETTAAERSATRDSPLAFKVQTFQVGDGDLRYYVRAEWKSGKEPDDASSYVLAAWMTPVPTLHILAVEKRTSPYDGIASALPDLLNVLDLGYGKTGIVVKIVGEDSGEVDLVQYRDGVNLRGMRVMQSIGVGE
jgi:hypothetical protein